MGAVPDEVIADLTPNLLRLLPVRLTRYSVVALLTLAYPLPAQTTAASHRVYWGSGPVTPEDSLFAMASMKSSLRDLVTRMEVFFSDSGHYPSKLSLTKGSAVPGVTLALASVSANGWAATATHRAFKGVSCVIAVNMSVDDELPATLGQHLSPREDGAPLCDDLRAVSREPKPVTLVGKVLTSVANDDAIDIGPGKFAKYKFQVPPSKLNCKLVGRVRGLAGGNKDVGVYFLTDDQFAEYLESPSGGSGVAPGTKPERDAQLDYQIYGSGTYYLVVSNRFSAVTTKVAQVKADVRCTDTPRPHIIE